MCIYFFNIGGGPKLVSPHWWILIGHLYLVFIIGTKKGKKMYIYPTKWCPTTSISHEPLSVASNDTN